MKGLIIIAEDGDAAVTSVDKAAAAGIPVISYDRLIKTDKIAAYLSFDNVAVGTAEADGVMKALGLPGSTTWTKDNPAKVVMSGGSPTDNLGSPRPNGSRSAISRCGRRQDRC